MLTASGITMRLSVNLFWATNDGYLPADDVCNGGYQAFEFLTVLLCLWSLATYNQQGHVSDICWPIAVVACLAVFVRPANNEDWSDLRWVYG